MKLSWNFTEDQLDWVCNGHLCPACLGTDITILGSAPDVVSNNVSYRCNTCKEEWEGY